MAAATRATASATAGDDSWPALAAETLRTYWRAAASISVAVAGGSRPRRGVMLRHMPPGYDGTTGGPRLGTVSGMRRSSAVLLTAVLLLSACGDDDGAQTASSGSDTTTTTEATTSTTDDAGATTTTTSTSPTTGELPGEEIDIFPYEGAALAVVGVAADDVLNVRTGPGTGFEVAFELEPLADDVVATGHNRMIEGEGMWAEVTSGPRIGWANAGYLLQPAQVTDITTQVAPTPAELPSAETLVELAEQVAATRASQEPPSTITVVDGPTVGDLGEITVDVVGMADDSVGGERLHVFATPDPGGEGFTLRTVEATLLCLRGVSDGLCV